MEIIKTEIMNPNAALLTDLAEIQESARHLAETPFFEWLSTSAAMLRSVNQTKERLSHWPYPGGRDEFLLRHGRYFPPAPWPEQYQRGPRGECFKNVIDCLAEWPGTFYYCEGIAQTSKIIPLHHAWLVTPDGHALDPTWEEDEEAIYFGVCVQSQWLWPQIFKHQFNTLLDDWKTGFPLYSGKLPVADVLELTLHRES